jgi:hypothetical protein
VLANLRSIGKSAASVHVCSSVFTSSSGTRLYQLSYLLRLLFVHIVVQHSCTIAARLTDVMRRNQSKRCKPQHNRNNHLDRTGGDAVSPNDIQGKDVVRGCVGCGAWGRYRSATSTCCTRLRGMRRVGKVQERNKHASRGTGTSTRPNDPTEWRDTYVA